MREGELVHGRFQIGRQAGAGAMGFVFQALDRSNGVTVAVKVLRSIGPLSLARFTREGEVLARLRAPEIAAYVAHGVTETGELFLAMEWIVGESFDDRLRRGPVTFGELVHVANAVARALVVAHANGVIHRDLKPANIMLSAVSASSFYPQVKVVDFGIAHVRGDGETLTETGDMIGTLAYMSPEQARGAKGLDGRTDLFALGAILFRSLAGMAPFEAGDGMATLLRLATERAPRIQLHVPMMPARLSRLVDALLDVDIRSRPADASVVARELEATHAELGPLAAAVPAGVGLQPTLIDRSASVTSRRRWPWALAAMLLLLLGGTALVALFLLPLGRSRPSDDGDADGEEIPARKKPTASARKPSRTLEGWSDYRDPRGAFEAKLECAARYKHIPRYDESGATLERSVSSCDSKRGFVAVSVSDVLAGATLGCDVSNRMSEELVMKTLGCTSVSRETIKTGVFEGMQVTVTCPDRGMQGHIRYLCDPSLVAAGKGRAFVAQLLRFRDEWDEAEAALFWATFKPHTLGGP